MEQKKRFSKRDKVWLVLLLLLPVFILLKNKQQNEAPYQTINGLVFGTVYNITYQSEEALKPAIEAELKRFDNSMSPFNPISVITKVNNNEEVAPDSFFTNVFKRSMEISQATDGAFDITVAPLVNAWGFGFKHKQKVDSLKVDSLLQIIGYSKVAMQSGKVVKQDPRIMIDCSAIAKGYACDVVADFLERKGIKNYMIDIGGELVVRGTNERKGNWRIGINKPVDDSLSVNQEIQEVLEITDIGMATSGNYRNFYYEGGKKYAHTIDPRSGFPVQHSLLSSTVIAKDCMTADAFATAFMVMGFEKAKTFVEAHPELEAYFIYTDEQGKMCTYSTLPHKNKINSSH